MEFAILGPLEIRIDRERVTLPTGRGQRALLLCLLLHRNEIVSVDALIEAVWPGESPATAAKIVQVYISQWRKIVGDRLETRAPGYLLSVHDSELDADRAQALAVEARGAAPVDAVAPLQEALALWRGEALVDVRYAPFAQPDAVRLDELRVSLAERRAEAELELGRHAEVIAELEALVATHPLHERFRAQLMLALYRSGRQADALAVYQDARRALVSELGLEPGDELQRVQHSILEHDASVQAPPPLPTPLVERVLRRPRRLALLGALLLGAAIAAAAVELTSGSSAEVVVRANSVAAIDPASNIVVADVPAGERPAALAFGFGSVWVANGDSGTVMRIDPRKKRVVATVGIGSDVSDLAIGFGSVWVADGNAGTVTRIDPTQNLVQATISFGPKDPLVPRPIFSVAVGEGYVWATRENTLMRIDPASDGFELWLHTDPATGLAVGSGRLWVATATERIVRYDAGLRDGPPTLTITTPSPPVDPLLAGGSLWAILNSYQLWGIDPDAGTQFGAALAGDGSVAAVWQSHSMWVANVGDRNVVRIDPNSMKPLAAIPFGSPPSALAAGDGLVWVAVDRAT